jgi:hypothetical protein
MPKPMEVPMQDESSSALGKNDPVALEVWFPSSAQRRARGWCLPGRRDALELVAEILEVVLADRQFPHFLDHRQEIGQRTDGA